VKKKLESKLHAAIEPSKYIEYDENKLFDTVIYFCYHQLKHINPNELPDIYIAIDTDYCKQIKHCGSTITWDGDTVLIALSTKNIKEDSEAGYILNTPIKSLFYIFLHEFHHLLVLIDLYLKRDKSITLEMIGAQRHNESLKERRRLRRQGFDSTEVFLNMAKEQECDWYAFQNLPLFDNLHEHNFLYTPRKAFMVKVKNGTKYNRISC
jgi:hypothetical protein